MKIENWSVCTPNPDPYKPPEMQQISLQGRVYGHPRPSLKDGDHIVTSTITGVTCDGHIKTLNSEYELGEIDPAYEKEFPDAKAKLITSLQKSGQGH